MSAMARLVVPSTVALPEYDATQLAATSRRPEALTATRLQRWLEGTPCKDTDTRVPADRGRSTNRALTGLPGRPAVATTGEVAPPGAPTSGERPTRNTATATDAATSPAAPAICLRRRPRSRRRVARSLPADRSRSPRPGDSTVSTTGTSKRCISP